MINLEARIRAALTESTCQKRITICAIYDRSGAVLAVESNRCSPPGGTCTRLGIVSTQSGYPSTSPCNWEHAEQRAVAALSEGAAPFLAHVYGHLFPCPDCEAALRAAGVEQIEMAEFPGTGLREVSA